MRSARACDDCGRGPPSAPARRPPVPRRRPRRDAARRSRRRAGRRRRPLPAARQGRRRRRAAGRAPRPRARSATPPARCFLLNDRPDLAAAGGADGVHVGQDDMPVGRARELVGADALVGLSTHSPQQAQAGCAHGRRLHRRRARARDADQAGPPRVGVELGQYAAAHAAGPVVRDRRHRRRQRRRRGRAPARAGSPSCARSPRPTTPRRRRARCAPPRTGRARG